MAKRILSRAPIQSPVVDDTDGRLSNDWMRFIGLVAENVFQRDKYTVTLNPAAVAANTSAEQTFSVSGLASGDQLILTKPTATAGLVVTNPRVSATDTLAVTFGNMTGSPIDPPSENYTIFVMKV